MSNFSNKHIKMVVNEDKQDAKNKMLIQSIFMNQKEYAPNDKGLNENTSKPLSFKEDNDKVSKSPPSSSPTFPLPPRAPSGAFSPPATILSPPGSPMCASPLLLPSTPSWLPSLPAPAFPTWSFKRKRL